MCMLCRVEADRRLSDMLKRAIYVETEPAELMTLTTIAAEIEDAANDAPSASMLLDLDILHRRLGASIQALKQQMVTVV